MAGQFDKRTAYASVRFSVYNLMEMSKKEGNALDSSIGESLAKAQLDLQELKHNISVESKKNFALERQIRMLDQKIALLVRNRISLEEVEQASNELAAPTQQGRFADERQKKHYENLFYLLQHEVQYMASLARLIKTNEIDSLLQTVMFAIYGNQYEAREEHLLLQLFHRVLKAECDTASGMGSLLRANTAITRMMTTYTRRGPGQSYLKQTLSPLIHDICQQNDLVLEINPMKVYEAMINQDEAETGQQSSLPRNVTAEVAAANPRVQQMIPERLAKLQETANKFLSTIIDSLDAIPYGIRWICKQIHVLAKGRFPEATKYELSSLQGGFFLLRFVNPAIVTPQAYMLVESKPGLTARKNLTYLAKLLQNLSNNTKFGGKEFYMEPANSFIQQNKERLVEFFDKMIDIEDPETALELEEILALTKTNDPIINISLNEIYFFHSLLYKHLDDIAKEADDHLRLIIKDLGDDIPPQLPRSQNATVNLHLYNRFETAVEEEAPGSIPDKPSYDQTYISTKYMLFNIFRELPTLAKKCEDEDMADVLQEANRTATQTGNVKLGEELVKILKSLTKLEDQGAVSRSDNYHQLRKDVASELDNLELHQNKMSQQKSSLSTVYDSIGSHNKYLQQQLATYQQYLQNVREKAYKPKDKQQKGEKQFKFGHKDLEKDGVIIESDVPEDRRSNVYFVFSSTSPGVFLAQLLYKGRSKPIYELSLKLDDLLESQHNNQLELELEYMKLNVNMLIHLLNKTFIKG